MLKGDLIKAVVELNSVISLLCTNVTTPLDVSIVMAVQYLLSLFNFIIDNAKQTKTTTKVNMWSIYSTFYIEMFHNVI